MHSTYPVDRSRTYQNSKEKRKSSEESWEQVVVPPDEAKLAETPGGDSNDDETKDDSESTQDGVENSKAKLPKVGKADDVIKVSQNQINVEVSTVAVDSLTGEQGTKTSADGKSKQTKLRLKRGITMDSGAGNNVMPRRMVMRKSDIRESEGSRNGVHYVAANNGRIPNEGEYDLKFNTAEGTEQYLTFQIAEVNKALCAISNLVDRGFKVVFDKNAKTDQDTSHMLNKETGVITRFRRTRNVWVLDAFVDNKSGNSDQSFHRRG